MPILAWIPIVEPYSFNIRVPQQATQFFFTIAELIIIMNYMDTMKVHIL